MSTSINLSEGAFKSSTLGNLKVYSVNLDKSSTQDTVNSSIHHIMVYDRSGSMSGSLKSLIADIKKSIASLTDGDELTLFWYSGEGQSGIVFNGIIGSINEKELNDSLEKASSTVGLTVFSETLEAIYKLVSSDTMTAYAITWFTDGQICTNRMSTQEEKQRIRNSISLISQSESVVGFNTVGYGNYYDKDLLVEMSSGAVLGSYNHAGDISDFSQIFVDFKTETSSVVGASIVITSPSQFVTVAVDNTIKTLKLQQSGDSFVTKLSHVPKAGLRLISDNELSFTVDDEVVVPTSKKVTSASIVKYTYGLAALCYASGRREDALDIIENEVGDANILSMMLGSYSINSIGVTYGFMLKAYSKATLRQFNTVTKATTQKVDVFSLITELKNSDALILMNPIRDGYKRIGRKAEEDETTDVKFVENEDQGELLNPASNISFSKTQFSVSILSTTIQGTVELNSTDRLLFKTAIDGKLPVSVIRTYSLIKDGSLNITSLVVRIPNKIKATRFKDFCELGEVNITPYDNGDFFINLEGLPLASRQLSRSYTEFKELAPMIKESLDQKIKLKVINHFRDVVKDAIPGTAKTASESVYTDVQIETLKNDYSVKVYPYGLVYQGFKKPLVEEGMDSFQTRFMEFGVKGYSTIPKIEEALSYNPTGSRVSAPKLYTKQLANELVDLFTAGHRINLLGVIKDPKEALEKLDIEYDSVKNKNSTDLLEQIKFIKGTTSGFFSDLELPDDLDKKSYELDLGSDAYSLTISYRKEYI